MNRPTRHLIYWLALAAASLAFAVAPLMAFAQQPPTLDAAALKKLGEANFAAANAGELAAAVGAISDASACDKVETSQRGMCVVMTKSFGMLAYVIGKQSETVTQVIDSTPAHAQAAAEPPPKREWYEALFDWGKASVAKVFDVGLNLGTTYYQTKLGMRQSDNATAQHAATVGGFVAMNNGTVRLGQTGFRTQYRTARDGFAMGTAIGTKPTPPTPPTTQITVQGNGNNVGGRDVTTTTTTTTTTDTVTCPLTQTARGGDGGNSTPAANAQGQAPGAPNAANPALECATRKQ